MVLEILRKYFVNSITIRSDYSAFAALLLKPQDFLHNARCDLQIHIPIDTILKNRDQLSEVTTLFQSDNFPWFAAVLDCFWARRVRIEFFLRLCRKLIT